MINRKDTPAPFMQRTDPPHSLDPTSTLPRNKTTLSTARSQQAPQLPRLGLRETSTHSNARGSTDNSTQDGRDSHDLSLTDNARHSVVDHMLLSLNPDLTKSFSPSRDRLKFSSGSDATSGPRHLHSSSTNSDFTFPSDGSPGRISNRIASERRSNSGSNFPTASRRADTTPVDVQSVDKSKGQISVAHKPSVVEDSPRGHTRKSSSKGSVGSSSLDYGHISGQLKALPELGRRSTSFDHGYTRRIVHSTSSPGTHPPLPSGLSQPILDTDEPAPTPSVPGGPRKDNPSNFSADATQSQPLTPQMQRRNSNRSTKGNAGKKGLGDGTQKNGTTPKSIMRSRRGSKQISPMVGLLKSRNTSPVRQFSEPLLSTRQESVVQSKEPHTNKHGFFRRVFGSSKGNAPASSSPQVLSEVPAQPSTRSNSRNDMASQSRLHKTPAMEDLTNPPELAPQSLHKKPSSFFRRRKKSVSDNFSPPDLPSQVSHNASGMPIDGAPRTSVSSLRKVMNPYLDDSPETNTKVGKADRPLSSHFSKLRSQKSSEPIRSAGASAGAIRPSQPRTLPSQEEIAAVQSLLNPNDNGSVSDGPDLEKAAKKSMEGVSDKAASKPSTTERATKFPVHKPARRVDAQERKESLASHKRASSKTADSVPKSNSESTNKEGATPEPRASALRSASTGEVGAGQPKTVPDDLGHDSQQPLGDAGASPISDYHSASSTIHPLKTTGSNAIEFPDLAADIKGPLEASDSDPAKPSQDDERQAKLLFEGDESIASKESVAAYLGEPGPERALLRQAYMALFQWQNLNILAALRDLCSRLYLKGEAQQVDRVLDSFSTRWCQCNLDHGFKAIDVVHTICYSLLMLNTDLHQAEIETKMTRAQFLKNIVPTIRRVVTDAAPDAFTNSRISTMPPARPWGEGSSSNTRPAISPGGQEGKRSFEGQRPVYKLSSRPSDQTTYTSSQQYSQVDFSTSLGESGPLVKSSFHGKLSTWESQIEVILKDFFTSIRQESLPLHGSESKEQPMPETPQTTHSLSAMTGNMLRRTPSMLSKAGSEAVSFTRGRQADGRLGTGRWQSKTRSRPRLYPASTVASSRRSSFDEQSSVTSPSVTSAWSRFSSFGRTQTSLSVESFASHFPPAEYQKSIGFANALSQAIIREEYPSVGDDESLRAAPLLEDESLELAGAPWAKEGILKHKHHLEAVDKRAKDRNWVESFAVIEKGQMRLFSFSSSAKSLRQKSKMQKLSGASSGGPVGGGNWADNAELLGSFALRQTIASALPPPGYSKARPHVWALSLPAGAVHLFQVGTPEIVKEFVTTANYWSARLSKEPLIGAISNIEYGWSDSVLNTALLAQNHTENTPLAPPGAIINPNGPAAVSSSGASLTGIAPPPARPSLQSSIRSARSSSDGLTAGSALRPKLPGDKITINEWQPPPQSLATSALLEIDQLRGLTSYVCKIEEELKRHNELRGIMVLAFSPRHPNLTRAMTNWERKSSYLLREIVKFRTYIDCLGAAQGMKEQLITERTKLRDEKAATSMMPGGENSLGNAARGAETLAKNNKEKDRIET